LVKRVSSKRTSAGVDKKRFIQKVVLVIFSVLSTLLGITFNERGKIPHSGWVYLSNALLSKRLMQLGPPRVI
jgi:hypothetical protein